LKEKCGGEVIVITMGPPQAEEVLRQAISCGADSCILVSDRSFAGSDTWATAYTLEHAVKKIGSFDLILCGKQAIDGDTAQVGPGLATRLGIPYMTCVQRIREVTDSGLIAERMMDDGFDVVAVDYPALLSVVKDINEPRVPSIKGKMKAKKAEIVKFNAQIIEADPTCIGLPGSPTKVVNVFPPLARGERSVLTGTLDEQINQLVEKLLPYL
jgi:electron transfer flavoprotein beta subunit